MKDKKEGSSDILMSDLVGVELLKPEAVTFEKKSLVPSQVNLSMLGSISQQQLVSIKAKLIALREPEIVTTPQFSLNKADGVLVDEHGTVKITFWGDDIQKVENGKTYFFRNLRLKKNKMNGELYVNPAKGFSSITEAEAFEKTLDVPEEVPSELTSFTIKLEIIGVTDVKLDHRCVKCNRVVSPRKITKCENVKCKLVQKIEKCKKEWYVRALVELENKSNMYLIFRNGAVKKVLSLVSAPEEDNFQEEEITEMFLSAPKLLVTYDSKNVVQNVEEFW